MVHLGNVAVSGTGTATSAYADLQGFDGATIVVVANTVTDAGTASGFTVTLQESADTTDAAATTVATANTVAGEFGYLGGKQYVGITVTGTTGSDADISIYAMLGKPAQAPTTFIGTKVART